MYKGINTHTHTHTVAKDIHRHVVIHNSVHSVSNTHSMSNSQDWLIHNITHTPVSINILYTWLDITHLTHKANSSDTHDHYTVLHTFIQCLMYIIGLKNTHHEHIFKYTSQYISSVFIIIIIIIRDTNKIWL